MCWRRLIRKKRARLGEAYDSSADEAYKAEIRAQYEKQGHPYYASARLWDDGIIDPADTRKVLGLGISAAFKRPN